MNDISRNFELLKRSSIFIFRDKNKILPTGTLRILFPPSSMPKKLLYMRISNMEKIKMKVRKGEYPTLTQTRFYNIILYVWYRRKSVQRH